MKHGNDDDYDDDDEACFDADSLVTLSSCTKKIVDANRL